MNRLRAKFIGILLGVALLPALPAAWIAQQLLDRMLDPVGSEVLRAGLNVGIEETRESLQRIRTEFRQELDSETPRMPLSLETLTREERATLDGLAAPFPARIQFGGRQWLVAPGPNIGEAFPGRVVPSDGNAWYARELSDSLVQRAEQAADAIRWVEAWKRERSSIVTSLLATFAVLYGLVLLFCIGIGLWLASRLTRPLTTLGDGLRTLAAGDLDRRVPLHGDVAMQQLLGDFNHMADQLQTQQVELVRLGKLEAWRQFSRSLAHEIKNPLTPIQLAVEQIRDTYPGDDETYARLVRDGATIVREEIDTLRNLVSQFSDFARVPTPIFAEVDPRDLTEDLQRLYGDQLFVSVPEPVPTIRCDREQVRRALINLINNALEVHPDDSSEREELVPPGIRTVRSDPGERVTHDVRPDRSDPGQPSRSDVQPGRSNPGEPGTPNVQPGQSERVTLETTSVSLGPAPQDEVVQFRVLDRGPGVPLLDRERIFEPDVTGHGGGMGLGLAIVRALAEAHGGTVEVTHRPEGGACFVLTLPRFAAPSPENQRPPDQRTTK